VPTAAVAASADSGWSVLTVGWLLSAADRDRFGGPYLILKGVIHTLKKGRLPSAGLRAPAFGARRPLRGIWRTKSDI